MSVIETHCANTIRGLAIDGVQAANSGHPGAPMGMADMATALWGHVLKYDASQPDWADRDRVVLSNGHGSMLLYSMLHLTGTSLSIDDLRDFRQWGAATAGHPEYGEAPGIETTTGPLGQGFATAVGMALAEQWMRERFSADLVDHHTFVLTGDGCLMEGISAEAASFAGHLGLGRLIVMWDDNRITIDGSTDLSFTEDVPARFKAVGWQVIEADGHDIPALVAALQQAKADDARPTLICCRTQIGRGSPNLEGSNKTHGSPLGPDEVAATKSAIGLDPAAFFQVDAEVRDWFRRNDADRALARESWVERMALHPDGDKLHQFLCDPDLDNVAWPEFPTGGRVATRKASHAVLQALAAGVENLIGGSADLAGSNGTTLNGLGDVGPGSFAGRNLHFGIREHAMGAICNGLALHGGVVPFCATFLVFHDYMRPAVRLAALMHQPVVYVYTHDSIFVGEDGPTHQPIEHLMSMRTMPGLYVVRPADATETVEAWKLAMERRDGPTALALTRQGLPVLDRSTLGSASGVHRGGYVLAEAEGGDARVVLVGTGSEVELALLARDRLQADGVPARVVSLPCWERFFEQDASWRSAVLPPGIPRVSVEAGCTFGWAQVVGIEGTAIGIDRFGASAPGAVVAEKLGLTTDAVVAAAQALLAN